MNAPKHNTHSRIQAQGTVRDRTEVAEGIFLVTVRCPEIARTAEPGQFLNIKALDTMWGPFLRRPFSISNIQGDDLQILFNVIGSGTRLLASRRHGDPLDLLGPLGKPFTLDEQTGTAIMVAGGLGFAPFPFLLSRVLEAGKTSVAFIGARSASQVYTGPFDEARIATDDGSKGFHGTVVQLLERSLGEENPVAPKIFGCGPTPMLRALAASAKRIGVPCELSLEGDMACGIGLCQGCPVETVGRERKYALVCTEGPTFDCEEVII